MVTTPEPSQQPVSPYDFFSADLAGQCHHMIFFRKSHAKCRHMIFRVCSPYDFSQTSRKGETQCPIVFCENSGAGPVRLCHHMIFFRQGWLAHVTI